MKRHSSALVLVLGLLTAAVLSACASADRQRSPTQDEELDLFSEAVIDTRHVTMRALTADEVLDLFAIHRKDAPWDEEAYEAYATSIGGFTPAQVEPPLRQFEVTHSGSRGQYVKTPNGVFWRTTGTVELIKKEPFESEEDWVSSLDFILAEARVPGSKITITVEVLSPVIPYGPKPSNEVQP